MRLWAPSDRQAYFGVHRQCWWCRLYVVLVIRFNDNAEQALGGPAGSQSAVPVEELAPRLRESLAEGLVWDDGAVRYGVLPQESRTGYDDLTWWEFYATKMHLEDYVPVHVGGLVDGCGTPVIGEADQLKLLRQGFGYALEIIRMARALQPVPPFRCVVGVNESCGTCRFHVGRPGEHSLADDLDEFKDDKMIVIDSGPVTLGGVPW